MQIFELTVNEASKRLSGLAALLHDCVESGASVGFLPPLQPGEAEAYWASVADCLAEGSRVLLAALDGDLLVGCVQLDYPTRPKASHRAEVMKLMVHTSARNRGIGRALMKQASAVAARSGRTLLVLDTRSGDPSESLYTRLGYTTAGVIPRLRPQRLWATPRHHDHVPASAPDRHKAAGLRRLGSRFVNSAASAKPLGNSGN